MKILFAGVTPAFIAFLKPVLSSSGCDVIVASDGRDALDTFCTERVDLILMDMDVRVMSGLEITGKIRVIEAMQELPWTPIVVLTAPDSLENPVTVIQAGADDLVSQTAPEDFVKAKILAMVRTATVRRQLETANGTLNNILNSVSEGVHVLDMHGVIIAENAASMIMFGWEDADSLVGRLGHDTIHHHHADNSIFPVENCPIHATLSDGKYRHVQEDVFWRRDNTCFPVEYKCAPLRDNAGNMYGVTVVFRDISERKKAEQHIIYLTQHCPLTDLPNRILFGDRLKQAILNAKRSRTKFALLFVDIDGFKPVNDRYGHAVGDMLLQRIGKRMKQCLRESDTIARIGGDEFVAILPVVNEAEDAVSIAEKLRQSIEEPFAVESCILGVSASIGVAFYPDDGLDEQTLQVNADHAMYQAKSRGGNAVVLNEAGIAGKCA
ncbi:diguanylate cyclase (plasmid) [Paraburkholderia sp. FT54]|uniref:diguanylate cyclase domain-containing protein n=1 Tax=Paraburkholderia sp. FT54 TaxID=3074437 RepID=UPI002877A3CC|nr:diguanylate cyclase [Paraburkholderia sp. FT54]WNC95481.1 diguanylate cyclase [Paraburkholderia sp. FT54]